MGSRLPTTPFLSARTAHGPHGPHTTHTAHTAHATYAGKSLPQGKQACLGFELEPTRSFSQSARYGMHGLGMQPTGAHSHGTHSLGAHISRQPFVLSQSPGRRLAEARFAEPKLAPHRPSLHALDQNVSFQDTEAANATDATNAAGALPATIPTAPAPAANALSALAKLDSRCAPQVWRAHQLANSATAVQSTHYPELDAELPGGGWPCRQVTELLLSAPASGEIRLLMPLLRELTRAGKSVAFIAPPHLPFGPALNAQGLYIEQLLIISPQAMQHAAQQAPQDSSRLACAAPLSPAALTDLLWSTEQVLKSGQFAAVVAWLPKQVSPEQLRRLHHAASLSPGSAFFCRPELAQFESSAAPLRIRISSTSGIDLGAGANSNRASSQHSTKLKQLQLHILKRRGPALQKPIALSLFTPATAPTASFNITSFNTPSASTTNLNTANAARKSALAPKGQAQTPEEDASQAAAQLTAKLAAGAAKSAAQPAQASGAQPSSNQAPATPSTQAQLQQSDHGFFLSGSFDQVMARLADAMT